eukprot:1248917-Amphidinium_carterae.1
MRSRYVCTLLKRFKRSGAPTYASSPIQACCTHHRGMPAPPCERRIERIVREHPFEEPHNNLADWKQQGTTRIAAICVEEGGVLSMPCGFMRSPVTMVKGRKEDPSLKARGGVSRAKLLISLICCLVTPCENLASGVATSCRVRLL